MAGRPQCDNCDNTGWVSYGVPIVGPNNVMRMRERITPCHLCNAGGSWSQWAQNVVDAGDSSLPATAKEKP